MLSTANRFLLARIPVRFPISVSLLSNIDNGHTTAHPPQPDQIATLKLNTARSTRIGARYRRLLSKTHRDRNRNRQHRTDSQPQSSAYQPPHHPAARFIANRKFEARYRKRVTQLSRAVLGVNLLSSFQFSTTQHTFPPASWMIHSFIIYWEGSSRL